ncbi:MAG: beta-1,6-N-acetylglucosaminyltransferase [Pseudomonadota bacterium]
MSIGISILAHSSLYRVVEVAQHFSAAGCRVAVHIDSKSNKSERAELEAALAEDPSVIVVSPTRCEWGTFALHEAGLTTARHLIETFEDVTHVALISGSCLPIRPITELEAFLNAHPNTDFVQSKRLGESKWVQEGLEEERFTLFHPFSWRSQRWLFDRSVELQRRLRVKRKVPAELELSIGSQWWTLTRKTLQAILSDPRKAEWDAFFKQCWIVDESYVQTLVRRHSERFEDVSLTLTEFDPQGKPFTFYDDHAQILEDSDKFFARKVWHGASALYSKYLYGAEPLAAARRAETLDLSNLIAQGRDRRCRGRTGLLSVSRFPCSGFERQHASARPYVVLDGYDALFSGLRPWLTACGVDLAHGRLFHPGAVEFDPATSQLGTGLIEEPKIRDWNPEQFLTSLLWHGRDKHQSFYFHAADNERVARFVLRDPNASIFAISDAWMLSLLPSLGEADEEFQRRALRLKALDAKYRRQINMPTTRAQVVQFTLEDILVAPEIALRAIGVENSIAVSGGVSMIAPVPKLRHDLGSALKRLASCGIDTAHLTALHSRTNSTGGAASAVREAVT